MATHVQIVIVMIGAIKKIIKLLTELTGITLNQTFLIIDCNGIWKK